MSISRLVTSSPTATCIGPVSVPMRISESSRPRGPRNGTMTDDERARREDQLSVLRVEVTSRLFRVLDDYQREAPAFIASVVADLFVKALVGLAKLDTVNGVPLAGQLLAETRDQV